MSKNALSASTQENRIEVAQELPAKYRDPISMLKDCHRRIEKFLQFLITLAQKQDTTLDEEARDNLEKALNYFIGVGELHNADEEISLFPRLQSRQNVGNTKHVIELIEHLEDEHKYVETIHCQQDKVGRKWLTKNKLVDQDRKSFQELTCSLIGIYEQHIAHEDNDLFVYATSVLSPSELGDIGEEMWERRGRKHCRTRTDSKTQGRKQS